MYGSSVKYFSRELENNERIRQLYCRHQAENKVLKFNSSFSNVQQENSPILRVPQTTPSHLTGSIMEGCRVEKLRRMIFTLRSRMLLRNFGLNT